MWVGHFAPNKLRSKRHPCRLLPVSAPVVLERLSRFGPLSPPSRLFLKLPTSHPTLGEVLMSANPFSPTVRQRRLFDYLHEHPEIDSAVALCHGAGISRTTYYRWCRDAAFSAWLGSAWGARMLLDHVFLINKARQHCDQFSFWKALCELTLDPKSLSLMAKWSESLTHLNPTAFLPAPPAPQPPPTPPNSRSWPPRRLTEAEWNSIYGVPPDDPEPSPSLASHPLPSPQPTPQAGRTATRLQSSNQQLAPSPRYIPRTVSSLGFPHHTAHRLRRHLRCLARVHPCRLRRFFLP